MLSSCCRAFALKPQTEHRIEIYTYLCPELNRQKPPPSLAIQLKSSSLQGWRQLEDSWLRFGSFSLLRCFFDVYVVVEVHASVCYWSRVTTYVVLFFAIQHKNNVENNVAVRFIENIRLYISVVKESMLLCVVWFQDTIAWTARPEFKDQLAKFVRGSSSVWMCNLYVQVSNYFFYISAQ